MAGETGPHLFHMNLGEKLREGTAWLASGSISNQAVQFLFGIALARLLVPADFGLLVTVQVFTGVLGHVAGGGMGSALVRAKDVEERDWRVVFTLKCAIGVAIYALLFVVAPFVAEWFSESRYEPLLRVSALSFLLRPFGTTGAARLQRAMHFKALALSTMLSVIVAGTTSVALAAAGHGVWSLVLGGVVGGVVNATSALVASRWRPAFALDWTVAKRHSRFGFMFSANDLVGYLRQQTSVLAISRVLGPALLGLYNKGASLAAMPVDLVSGSAYQVMFRALATTQDNHDRSRYIYYRAIQLIIFYLLPFYVGLGLLAEPFILTLYGERWLLAAAPLQVLALGGLFQCMGNQAGAVVAASGQLGRELVRQLTAWGFLIAGLLVAVPHGIIACAWVVLVVRIGLAVSMTMLAQRILAGSFRAMMRALRPALVMNAALIVALIAVREFWFKPYAAISPSLYLAGMTAVGALLYGGMFLLLPLPELATEARRWRRRLGLA